MPETLCGIDADRLERSGSRRPDSIRFGTGALGLERAEVYLSTIAFEPHRHDTYAIGITTAGVQTFYDRGSRRLCLPGQLHILHPDELHDGAEVLDPCLLRTASQGERRSGSLKRSRSIARSPHGLDHGIAAAVRGPVPAYHRPLISSAGAPVGAARGPWRGHAW